MLNNKLIRREISILDYLMLTTGKVLVGIGIGIVFVSHFFYAQPYWFVWIIAGVRRRLYVHTIY